MSIKSDYEEIAEETRITLWPVNTKIDIIQHFCLDNNVKINGRMVICQLNQIRVLEIS